MAEKKKSYAVGKGITPKGTLIFPYLNKPDTKFNPEGDFRTKLKVSAEDAPAMIAKLDAWYDLAIAAVVEEQKLKAKTPALAAKITVKTLKKAADKPYKPETDDEGNETGALILSFKQKAKITGKDGTVYEKKVDLFDAAKQSFPRDKLIYGGSTGKVAFEALPWFTPALGAGLSLRLNGVQIIELRTSGPKDADAYGFEDEGEGLGDPQGDEAAGDGAAGGDPTDF